MDAIIALLTTTEGRIGRKQWWLGVLVMVVIAITASIVLGILSFGNLSFMAWAAVLINLLLVWPSYCIGLKRRHDRGNDGMDLKILVGASLVINLVQASGVGVTMVENAGLMVPMPSLWLGVLNLAFAIFAIYMLVQLGLMRGTPGANRYGPDPLDAAA